MRFLKLQPTSFRRRKGPLETSTLWMNEPSCIWCRKVWDDAMQQTSIEKKNLKWKKTAKTAKLQSSLVGGWTTHSCQNWIISPGIGLKIKKCLKSSPSSLLGLAEVVRSVPVRQEGEKKNHFFVGHSWLPWRVMYLPCFVEYINIQWCVLKRVLLPDLILSQHSYRNRMLDIKTMKVHRR